MSESAAREERKPRVPLWATILVAMAAGAYVGPMLGPKASGLGELGRLVIQIIKAAATPLLFFAILSAILKTRVDGRAGLRMIAIATLNASIAIVIGLLLSNIIEPGHHLGIGPPDPEAAKAYADKRVDLLDTVASYVPTSFVQPFAENLVITIILLALLLGFGLRRVRDEQLAEGKGSFYAMEDAIESILRALEILIGWIIKLVPFAVFGVVAKTIGQYGFSPLKGLGIYVGVALLGFVIHIAVVYHAWIVLVARIPVRKFWSIAKEPVVYGVGTNSSLATLPVTLRALDRLGVSRSASTLGACVGTNLNNDGIVLYEGMAVLFVAQASGIDLPISAQIVAAVTCMIAAMGVAGVPEAGFISLALVLNTVGLPVELLPLILTVDWIIARARSIVNVLSDMVLSIGIDGTGGARDTAPGASSG